MKNILLLCVSLMLSFSAFTQTGYTVYLGSQPINDYSRVDLNNNPASITVVNTYSKYDQFITLVSKESSEPDVYYSM